MAITRIEDMKGGASGSWSGDAGRRYTNRVRVFTDSAMGPRSIIASLGFRQGDFYRWPLATTVEEWDYGSFVKSIEVEPVSEDGLLYTATIGYEPYDWNTQGGAGGEGAAEGMLSPFAVPPQVRWASDTFEVAAITDIHGKPILTTAKLPFDPPLTKDDDHDVLTIVRNERTYDPLRSRQYKRKTNSTEWLGYPAGVAKCRTIVGDKQYQADWGDFWQVTYEFAFKFPDEETGDLGWTEKVLNRGKMQRSTDGTKVEHIIVQGAPTQNDMPLTKEGRYDPDADPYYLEVELLGSADFNDFDFPANLLNASGLPGAQA